jgi:hypothetical protein
MTLQVVSIIMACGTFLAMLTLFALPTRRQA